MIFFVLIDFFFLLVFNPAGLSFKQASHLKICAFCKIIVIKMERLPFSVL